MPQYGFSLAFRLDALSLLLLCLATGIGALVLVYCARYFDSDEPGLGLFAAALTGFAGAMIGLVLADDLIALFVFWELTTVLSFLLIGHYTDARRASQRPAGACTVTTLGGLALLAGVVMLGNAAGTYRISAILAAPAARRERAGRARAAAGRRLREVGRLPVQPVAARRDGRADAGQRVPARRRHGQGRRLPDRPVRPGLRLRPALAAGCASASAVRRCCSAASGPCGRTTSSGCSPSAP